MKTRIGVGCALLALGAAESDAAVRIEIEPIALTGAEAPGAPPGALFSALNTPLVSGSGKVAFQGFLEAGPGGVPSTTEGIWGPDASGDLTMLVWEGSPGDAPPPPPLPTDARFHIAITPAMNLAGQILVNGSSPDVPDSYGLWAFEDGAGTPLLLYGDEAPGIAGGVFGLPPYQPGFNDNGEIAFAAALLVGPGGVESFNDWGLWGPDGSGGLALIAREGTQVSGADPGVYFASFGGVPLNDAGQLAFKAWLGRPFGDPTKDFTIWAPDGAGGVSEVARVGEQAPGAPPGAVFFVDDFHGFSPLVLDGAGGIAFSGFTTEGQGIWRSEPDGQLAVLAFEGEPAPGGPPGSVFAAFSSPLLSKAGGIVFEGSLSVGIAGVTEEDDEGIWGPDGAGGITMLVREGDAAPGGPGEFANFLGPGLDEADNVVFGATLRGAGIDAVHDMGIFWRDAGGWLRAVVREGQILEVAPGDQREVTLLQAYTGSPDLQSGRRGFNDARQVAFEANLTGDDEGVFVATVPEPSRRLAAAVLFALWQLRRRLRGRTGSSTACAGGSWTVYG